MVSVDGWTVGSRVHLTLNLGQSGTGFLLGSIAAAQLLALTVDHAGVHGELVAHDRLAASTPRQLNASDLRRQLPAFSHRGRTLGGCLCMGSDEAVDLG